MFYFFALNAFISNKQLHIISWGHAFLVVPTNRNQTKASWEVPEATYYEFLDSALGPKTSHVGNLRRFLRAAEVKIQTPNYHHFSCQNSKTENKTLNISPFLYCQAWVISPGAAHWVLSEPKQFRGIGEFGKSNSGKERNVPGIWEIREDCLQSPDSQLQLQAQSRYVTYGQTAAAPGMWIVHIW